MKAQVHQLKDEEAVKDSHVCVRRHYFVDLRGLQWLTTSQNSRLDRSVVCMVIYCIYRSNSHDIGVILISRMMNT